ncbi:MAG: YraN family protein [Nitrososphaeria archaeon]|nr:YraN family protein [Nitrososphaeria archaeon]
MSKRGISSERIAKSILKKMGFQILEKNKKVVLNGTQVFEVDLIAKDEMGDVYCVEVKAGRIGVSDVRQAYANSMVLGLKPLIICKGYADKATEVLAEELKVKVFLFPDYYYLIEPEDLDYIVREAVRDVLEEYGLVSLTVFDTITKKELKILKTLSEKETFEECAKSLNISLEKLGEHISLMREKGLLRKTEGYEGIRRQAKRTLIFLEMINTFENIQKNIKNILKRLETKN